MKNPDMKKLIVTAVVGLVLLALCLTVGAIYRYNTREAVPNATMMLDPLPDPAPLGDVVKDASANFRFDTSGYDRYTDLAQAGRDCVIYLFPTGIKAMGDIRNGDVYCEGDKAPSLATVTVWQAFTGSNFTGNRLDGVTTHLAGCSDNSQYNTPTLPAGWDNVTSSMKAITASGCDSLTGYNDTYYGGGQITASPLRGLLGESDNVISSFWVFP